MGQAEIRDLYEGARTGPWCDIQGHLQFLFSAAANRAGAVVIEAGVRYGMSTRAFLAGVHQSRGQVWSCDIADPAVPEEISSDTRWHFLKAGDLSQEALDWFPAKADVLFLDAHADDWAPEQVTAQVLVELTRYVPRVKPGGLVLAHDTEWQPPNINLGQPAGPVASALDTYCEQNGLKWRNRPGWYGLGCIRV